MNWGRYANSVFVLKVLGVYGGLVTCAVTLPASGNRRQRAVLGVAWGLILLWIVVGGILTRVLGGVRRPSYIPARARGRGCSFFVWAALDIIWFYRCGGCCKGPKMAAVWSRIGGLASGGRASGACLRQRGRTGRRWRGVGRLVLAADIMALGAFN